MGEQRYFMAVMSYAAVVQSFLPRQPEKGVVMEEAVAYGKQPLALNIRQGLSFSEFASLLSLFQIPEEDLGRLVGMSPATLARRKKNQSLTSAESERVVRFARLFGLAYEVFETEEGARDWLKTENPGTAGEAPLSWADTEYGAREVENLLGRIDHGIF